MADTEELRKLDAEIAEKLMGWTHLQSSERPEVFAFLSPESRASQYFASRVKSGAMVEVASGDEINAPRYSTDITAAMTVVEKIDRRMKVDYFPDSTVSWCVMFVSKDGEAAWADSLPLAICRAALAIISEQ